MRSFVRDRTELKGCLRLYGVKPAILFDTVLNPLQRLRYVELSCRYQGARINRVSGFLNSFLQEASLMRKPKLLCIGHDEQLLQTRLRVLALQYETKGAMNFEEMEALAGEDFDLILLCHSVSPEERPATIALARQRWPNAKFVQILREDGERHPQGVDAQVGSLDGPRALLQTVEQLLPCP